MPAGPELDALVVLKVLGGIDRHTPHCEATLPCPPGLRPLRCTCGVPVVGDRQPSTNIAHAWEVQALMCFAIEPTASCWHVYRQRVAKLPLFSSYGEAPLAICRAALKAVTP
jgi:hypothetical protein